jgi:predicted acyltransferase
MEPQEDRGAIMTSESKPKRWPPLDVLRGAAVAGMIVVTSPGDWNHTYSQLRHADWNGWTLTDMVFPAFLFSVGVALALPFPRPLEDVEARSLFRWRIARRTLALIVVGLALNWVSELVSSIWASDARAGVIAHVRLPGVLQRIALCYALAAAVILATSSGDDKGRTHIKGHAILVASGLVLLLYWGLMSFVPVPGFGAGRLDPAGNLAAYIDRAVFTVPHLWRLGAEHWGGPVTYDPEGLLSTLPATVNVLLGVLAAREWQRSGQKATWRIAGAGVLLFAAGLLLDPVFVINKRIWTSSFALLSSGFAATMMAGVIVALRSERGYRLTAPLRILGGNAILAFALSILLGQFIALPVLPVGGTWVTPQNWANALALGVVPDPYLASLACGLAVLALITLAVWPLHRRGIHLRL